MATGLWPSCRHTGEPFGEGDEGRSPMAGHPLLLGALVHIKGDWSEFVHSFGMMAWSSILHPCFRCHTSLEDMPDYDGFSLVAAALPFKTADDYEAATSACEFVVRILDEGTKAQLIGLLFFDKRKKGFHGRALRAPMPILGLLRGDRLEPSHLLRDVFVLEQLAPPFDLLFWRQGCETLAKHRCPIFQVLVVVVVVVVV
jgi:hypothetical protein